MQSFTSLLFGMLGAIIVFMVVNGIKRDNLPIGTVNITGLVNHFIKQEATKDVSPEILEKNVKQYGLQLNKALQKFSSENHVILFLSEAVITQCHDYTSAIQQKMQLDGVNP